VTLIVGIICKDAIVFGAESETTRGSAKQHGTEKISIIEFLNGYALVGEAGAATYSNIAVDSFKRKAAGREITDDRTIANAAKDAVLEFRNHMTSLHPGLSPTNWEDFFYQEQNDFELTLGYYFSGKAFLFKFRPMTAWPQPIAAEFSTSGIGSDLAHYLLKDFPFGQISSHQATLIASYVVKEAKGSVAYCGGGTSLAVVSQGKRPEKISAEQANAMELQITNMVAMENRHRLQQLSEIVNLTKMEYQSLRGDGSEPSED
jgi:20S proteasome alpha/beta subunit